MIDPRKLDQKIEIQAVTLTEDGMGSSVETWAAVSGAPTWAQYIPLRGLERITAGQVAGSTEFKLRIRRWASLTSAHRIIHNGNTCEILGIEDNFRDGDMVVHCKTTE